MKKHPFHLTYDTPADHWTDALPLGNGRLGAMVYGRTEIERIQLNDDSLWYGAFADRNNPALKDKLPEIRKLVFSGEIKAAEDLMMQYMVGAPSSMRHYTNLGELGIALNQRMPFAMGGREDTPPPEEYLFDLDLMTGISTVAHKRDGTRYHREMFISYPDQVMCIKLTADTPRAMNLDTHLNRVAISDTTVADDRRPGRRAGGGGWPAPNADIIRAIDDATFMMSGADSKVEFAAAFRMVCDGEIVNPVSQLLARNCSEVIIYLATSTTNRNPNPAADVLARLDAAQKKGYEAIRADHIADFFPIMDRCVPDFGGAPDLTTDKRIFAVRDGASDPALAALYFQFGRYLIAAGGRPNSSALNLQGIWNADFMPMWDSKYTININLQMNYWLAEVGNLSEMHEGVFDLLEKMHKRGLETARLMYGMRGMVCHHNTDFYGDCAPQDAYMASTPWVTGGAWMALHVWEHYLHTRDKEVLRRLYPIMEDMVLFYEDFLIEVDGKLITCPSISPENRYIMPDGYDTPICAAPAMDNQILREFFGVMIKIQSILEIEDAGSSERLAVMIEKLPKDKIGSKGQLLEWAEEYPELTPGMSHVSHLFAAYPGTSVNRFDTPDLMAAVGKSLELRLENGAGRGGWPLAWYICLHARLLDGQKTDDEICAMLARSATRSLLNAGRVFQIDGNLGAAAGIAECLLQSHKGIHLLPALPASWKRGGIKGLVARGGVIVDMQWDDGKLTEAVLRPKFDGAIELIGEPLKVTCGGGGIPVTLTEMGFSFHADADKVYSLIA
jgi:alpha-L-fucosidase 2